MIARGLAVACTLAATIGVASATPRSIPLADEAVGARADLSLTGGALHPFDGQWAFVTTAELGAELPLSARLSLLATLPVAMVDRDRTVVAGWGNLAAGLRLHASSTDGSSWLSRSLVVWVAAPTALDHGAAGLAARLAADLHAALDLGNYQPGTATTSVTAALRRQTARWWLAGALRYRLHLFTYDRGDDEILQLLAVSVGGGLRGPTWSAGVTFDTTVDVLEARWGDGDHFRHVVQVGVERRAGDWRASAGIVAPVDLEARALQTPMVALGLGREL